MILTFGTATVLQSQDYFPEPIPDSGIAVKVTEIATVPDSTPNQPPRISVLTADPSGRLFANDQRGPLYLIDERSGNVTEFLDLRDFADLAVLSGSEPGFQGFAFHPDFHRVESDGHGKFYTIHSSSNTTSAPDFDPGGSTSFHTLLLEWTTADPASEIFIPGNVSVPYRELMRLKQPFGNHNAGNVAFNPTASRSDPDYGNLYIAIGDGGSGGDPQGNGQDASNPFGALLRIDPLVTNSVNGKYGIPAGNVFAADNDPATLAEIYCYGLRNPQRFGWDLVTGNLFIADIGQNAVEEINLASNGANFGWNQREGSFQFNGPATPEMINPVAEYDHTNTVANPPTSRSNRAITIGEVIRGACLPELEGVLPLADFPTGLIFILNVDNDPLQGGQDGLRELYLLDSDNQKVRLLDLINAARSDRGLGASVRADLRFSVNTPGRFYITNKHDGIIRRILPTSEPGISISDSRNNQLSIDFQGILQSSEDLQSWETVVPQPPRLWIVSPENVPRYIRSICR